MKAIIIVNGVISPGIDVGENCGIYVRKFKLMPIGSYVQLYDEKEPILEMAKISFYKLVSGVGLLVEVDVAERAFNILVEECTGKECGGGQSVPTLKLFLSSASIPPKLSREQFGGTSFLKSITLSYIIVGFYLFYS